MSLLDRIRTALSARFGREESHRWTADELLRESQILREAGDPVGAQALYDAAMECRIAPTVTQALDTGGAA